MDVDVPEALYGLYGVVLDPLDAVACGAGDLRGAVSFEDESDCSSLVWREA